MEQPFRPKPKITRGYFEVVDAMAEEAKTEFYKKPGDKDAIADMRQLVGERDLLLAQTQEEAGEYNETLNVLRTIQDKDKWVSATASEPDPYSHIPKAMPSTGKGSHDRLQKELATIEKHVEEAEDDIETPSHPGNESAAEEKRNFWREEYAAIAGPTMKFLSNLFVKMVQEREKASEDETKADLTRISQKAKAEFEAKRESHE